VTTQKSEDLLGQAAAGTGVPGTQSNLPRAVPRAVGGSGVNSSRKSEGASFETSKMIRHVKTPQGSIRRLSASLLLDQEARWEGTGKNRKLVITPPTPEKIKAINDVVAGVIGLQADRGDKLVIESLPFEQTRLMEAPDELTKAPEKPKDLLTQLKDPKIMGGIAAGVVVLLGLVFFMLNKSKNKAKAELAAKAALAAAAEHQKSLEAPKDAVAAIESKTQIDSTIQLPPMTKRLEGLRDHIKENVRKDPEIAAEVLRGWLGQGR
jgi:flagellar M-ring protein FliF